MPVYLPGPTIDGMATEYAKFDAKAEPMKIEGKDSPVGFKGRLQPVKEELPKTKFLVWFSGALARFDGIQAHHMTAIRAYFLSMGLGEPETVEEYDQGLIKFGFGRKN